MRVVVDTNILLASIGHRSPYRRLFNAILKQEVQLLVSTSILLEYEEILTERNNALVAANIIQALNNLRNVHRYDVYFDWRLIHADPDDEKFVDCYVAGNGDYLITDDRHFGVLAQVGFPSVRVISALKFLELLPN